MSKPAIDELLDSVSGCDLDHERFSERYAGVMDDDTFLLEVADYVESLHEQRSQLNNAMQALLPHVSTHTEGPDMEVVDEAYKNAIKVLAKDRGETT